MAQRKVIIDWKAYVLSKDPPKKEPEYKFSYKTFYRYPGQLRGSYTS